MEIIHGVASQIQRYPWDEWLDGQARRAKQHDDFAVSPRDFGLAIRKAAKVRHMQVTVAINTKRGTVDFQAIVPPPAESTPAGPLLVSFVGP